MKPVLDEKQTRDELFKTFQYFDRDNSGYITVVELSTILQQFGSVYSDKQISKMIAQVDRDSDGRLNFDGFFLFYHSSWIVFQVDCQLCIFWLGFGLLYNPVFYDKSQVKSLIKVRNSKITINSKSLWILRSCHYENSFFT